MARKNEETQVYSTDGWRNIGELRVGMSPLDVLFVCLDSPGTEPARRTAAAYEKLYAKKLVRVLQVKNSSIPLMHIANHVLCVCFFRPVPPFFAHELSGIYDTTHRGHSAVGDVAVSQLRVRHEARELMPQYHEARRSAGNVWGRPPRGVV